MPAPKLWGSEFLVNTTIKYDQVNVKLHARKDGSFLAVWEDRSETGGDTNGDAIRGQIFNADGSKRGGEFLVNTTITNDQSNPMVTVLSDGRFIMFFDDYSSGRAMVRARAYQADGTALGNDFEIAAAGLARSSTMTVAALSDGGFAIAYPVAGGDIAVQSFNGSLQPQGSAKQITSPTGDGYSNPMIVALQGKFAISFGKSGSDQYAVHQHLFNNDGSAPTGSHEVTVSPTVDSFIYTGGAALANGSTAVTWRENTDLPGGDSFLHTLKVQILNQNGTKSGNEIVVFSGENKEIQQPKITPLVDGGFVMAYTVYDYQKNNPGTYLATFNSKGVRVASDMLLNDVIRPESIALTTLADGRVVLSWETEYTNQDNMHDGIVAQIFDPRQKAISLSGTTFKDQYVGTDFGDRLGGGLGNDQLTGGKGKDGFVFNTTLNKSTNVDKILDFKSTDDSFFLENKVFTKLGSGSSKGKKFSQDMFVEGTRAQDAEDRIIYSKKTGALYYDQDGTGAKAQVKIATLTNKAKLYYHDFFVI